MPFNLFKEKAQENPAVIKHWRKNPKSIEKYQFVYNFLPNPDKKRRASLISNKAVFIYCSLIVIVTLAFRIIPKFAPGVLGYASNINVKDLLEYTNGKREEVGLSDLKLNSKLTLAAQEKAADMFKDGYWAHVAPDGAEPWDFILAQNYDYIYAGENLAKNFSTSKEVVEAWYKSPSHKSNLLGANYDEVGFAVVNGVLNGYETTLVVQMFGRPREPSMVASVYEEESVLKESVNNSTLEPVKGSQTSALESSSFSPSTVVSTPKVDMTLAAKSISLAFGGFVGSLLAIDMWYSRKKGINKFTGQTFAHIIILIVVIISVWFVLQPGIVL
ncbi:CAP domain-containing protein [candidate division WWE3 bacterium]|uniref:CAP domain-containing protein n=1 Tax=candidate division WWE3 bacterium TaxID=2053526 RepID=A0A7X9E710_UNCKA|nr:CAP domain-containing protein [candidate division WWE3 bacterium]